MNKQLLPLLGIFSVFVTPLSADIKPEVVPTSAPTRKTAPKVAPKSVVKSAPLSYAVRPSSQTVKRREAVLALSYEKDVSQVGPKLVEALADKDPMSRTLAVQGIGNLKYGAAREKVSHVLATDPSVEAREAAAVTLRQLGDVQAVGALAKAVSDTSPNVRTTALAGLAYYRDRSALPQVEAACKDEVAGVRRTALYAIGRMEATSSEPVVQALLKDSDAAVRALAAQTLGEIRATSSTGALKDLLSASEKSVQVSAARSLLKLGDSSGLETAKALSRDEDITVRLLAIDALGWSKDKAAGKELETLLTKVPDNSRIAVQEALTRHQQLRKQK
jgi:HEAT repeat protein